MLSLQGLVFEDARISRVRLKGYSAALRCFGCTYFAQGSVVTRPTLKRTNQCS